MDWNSVAQGLFACMALAISGWVASSIDKMRGSVEALNVKIAVVISRTDNHEQRLNRLENYEDSEDR